MGERSWKTPRRYPRQTAKTENLTDAGCHREGRLAITAQQNVVRDIDAVVKDIPQGQQQQNGKQRAVRGAIKGKNVFSYIYRKTVCLKHESLTIKRIKIFSYFKLFFRIWQIFFPTMVEKLGESGGSKGRLRSDREGRRAILPTIPVSVAVHIRSLVYRRLCRKDLRQEHANPLSAIRPPGVAAHLL